MSKKMYVVDVKEGSNKFGVLYSLLLKDLRGRPIGPFDSTVDAEFFIDKNEYDRDSYFSRESTDDESALFETERKIAEAAYVGGSKERNERYGEPCE